MGLFDNFFYKKNKVNFHNMPISDIAANVNLQYNVGNKKVAAEILLTFYNIVQRGGGITLINLPVNDCQSVGFAFTIMALNYDHGDDDINSVAAENAFYCLSKSFIETGNFFAVPALFRILSLRPELMRQKLISSWVNLAQKQIGMPIGIALGGNPYNDPILNEFRDQAIGFKECIKYYLLSKFYDLEKKNFKVPTDMFLQLPSIAELNAFFSLLHKDTDFESGKYLKMGKEHFESLYKECEDTLKKF